MSTIPRRASRTADYPARPHSVGHHSGLHPEDQPYLSSELLHADDMHPQRPHTSIRTYQNTQGQQVIERGHQRIIVHQQPPPRRHFPWLLLICIGMLVGLLAVFTFNAAAAWWSANQLNATYGLPRTYQTDAVVYHGDSAAHPSHYIFINLDGTVQIIELPAGDSAHARIYKGPTLVEDNAALVPVTGEFKQVNGREEMIVHIGDQEVVYVNNGQKFVPQQ